MFIFSSSQLVQKARSLSEGYANALPWPHAVIDDFLPTEVADQILSEFPAPDHPAWLDWRKRDTVHQPKKLGIGNASRMELVSPILQHLMFNFQSHAYIRFLETLTGIPKLLPDPHFNGGGLHQILAGGHLSVHADFNYLAAIGLYRRINVLLYLNKDWEPSYGGDLELWGREGEARVKSVAPLFNRLVVFNTTKDSFHGHPKPLATPDGVTRKSLAFYYYTAEPVEGGVFNGRTDWIEAEGT